MTRAYKITYLPKGYSKLAIAAWKMLSERELFEIDGKLIFTDNLTCYLDDNQNAGYCANTFDSHASFEKWLLDTVAKWIEHGSSMLNDIDQYL